MQEAYVHTGIDELEILPLDGDLFLPIDMNWRKKYYVRVLKKRAAAYLLDIILTVIPALILSFALYFITLVVSFLINDKFFDHTSTAAFALMLLGSMLFYFLLLISIMESRWRATFGKKIMKIEITDEYGEPVSFWRSLLRNFLKLVVFGSYLFVIPLIIQCFTFSKRKKLFHDGFSGTIIGERLK
jgi:uncharacterized RDD family membrane protein YckC